MSSASSFFILIPAMYCLFTLAMVIIAVVDRRLLAPRWAALGFAIAFVSILADGYRAPGANNWLAWFTVATHFAPLLVMLQAFLARHDEKAPAMAVTLAMFGSIWLMPAMPWTAPQELRGFAVQSICAGIICAGLPRFWALRRTSQVDMVVLGVIAAAALSYLGRTVVIALHPIGTTHAQIIAFYTGLNTLFHSASALMGMSVGIVLLMTVGYDMICHRIAQSEIDPLTRLGNRRRLERWISEDEAGRRAIGGVMVVDLDHFKRVNDTYGHDGGDAVLRAVSACLEALFVNDAGACSGVFRTGGEEFVVLVEACDAGGLRDSAQEARGAIAALTFDHVPGGAMAGARITASIGYHRRYTGEAVDHAIRRADEAVYRAKAEGRDRVVASFGEGGLKAVA